MKIIEVKTNNSYFVKVDGGLLDSVAESVVKLCSFDTACVITDSNVGALYLERVVQSFVKIGKKVLTFVFDAGEQSKTLSTFGKISSFLAQNNFKRSDLIVALGGGVVGDLAGFVASTYHRGVKFVQIPTTLLAGIDSSVGGKTAVDLPEGKNLVGAFYQPVGVYFDTEVLGTLPKKELINGYGELVKYGVLTGGELWKTLSNDEIDLEKCIEECVRYKSEIVEKDEKDNGIRALLNLGHTLAHSVENLSGYTVSHGVSVGYGLRRIADACFVKGILAEKDHDEIIRILDKFSLDYRAPYSTEELVKEAFRDKKSFADSINLIIIEAVGKCRIQTFKLDELEDFFND